MVCLHLIVGIMPQEKKRRNSGSVEVRWERTESARSVRIVELNIEGS